MKTTDPKPLLAHAHQLASKGAFNELLQICRRLQTEFPSDTELLLDVAGLLLSCGFLSRAEDLLLSIQEQAPGALRVLSALASIHSQRADHLNAAMLYEQATLVSPTDTLSRRGKLLALQYDPATSSEERLGLAKVWGTWATARAGGSRPRPPARDVSGSKLRIGYVSADICQHTVGLFARGIFAHHQSTEPFVYSAGVVDDWVTDQIKKSACVRDVRDLNDLTLAKQIRDDQIDVLVDLSGHTGGSRLTVFAHRPAPVMVSWLGYFATSGLDYMDGVILDEWHAPENAQFRFAEPIIRLAKGRLCYDPVPFAPNVKPSPSEKNSFVTLGSFNNTAKLSDETIATWADATSSIPNGRLILKWRTFNDPKLCEQTFSKFEAYGLSRDQLELRGPSFHKDLLAEYADIDIALDPFPFTGGLTTCEALWMGVPVVTLPQERTVSRQGLAILSQIGLHELVATDPKNYVEIVTKLATSPARLQDYRQNLRVQMQRSQLCDVASFTAEFEEALSNLHTAISSERGENEVASSGEHRPIQPHIDNEVSQMRAPKIPSTLLHIGCGPKKKSQTTSGFNTEQWTELRLDIDPAVSPDLIGTMLDMSAVETGSVDAVFSSHNIEHVYAHEVPLALAEMRRVLTEDGFLIITCPDLQSVCELVAEGKLVEAAYQSPAGPIAPIDILYGHRPSLAGGNDYMAHKCGFTAPVLVATIKAAGFISTAAIRRKAPCFDLWVLATCSEVSEEDLRTLAAAHFPGT